jgi:hypothetical protein
MASIYDFPHWATTEIQISQTQLLLLYAAQFARHFMLISPFRGWHGSRH